MSLNNGFMTESPVRMTVEYIVVEAFCLWSNGLVLSFMIVNNLQRRLEGVTTS